MSNKRKQSPKQSPRRIISREEAAQLGVWLAGKVDERDQERQSDTAKADQYDAAVRDGMRILAASLQAGQSAVITSRSSILATQLVANVTSSPLTRHCPHTPWVRPGAVLPVIISCDPPLVYCWGCQPVPGSIPMMWNGLCDACGARTSEFRDITTQSGAVSVFGSICISCVKWVEEQTARR